MDEPIELEEPIENSQVFIQDVEADEPTTSSKETKLSPLLGYSQEPLLPLAEACEPLVPIVHEIQSYAAVALVMTANEPADNLTRDESAAIRLYTMQWRTGYRSLYLSLNRTLKSCDRDALKPWFKYLKLLLTALAKIPCCAPQAVWRGVRSNISHELPKNSDVLWWTFSSCTTKLDILTNNLYLGQDGARTLLNIEILNGRNIAAHSCFKDENEILMLPGTKMKVQAHLTQQSGLHIIHLKQIIPKEVLLEPPFEGTPSH